MNGEPFVGPRGKREEGEMQQEGRLEELLLQVFSSRREQTSDVREGRNKRGKVGRKEGKRENGRRHDCRREEKKEEGREGAKGRKKRRKVDVKKKGERKQGRK